MVQPWKVRTALSEAKKAFYQIGREAELLEDLEKTSDLPKGTKMITVAKGWQKKASTTGGCINEIRPLLKDTVLVEETSQMLNEIIFAETPQLVIDRYYGRRDDIELNLLRLGDD